MVEFSGSIDVLSVQATSLQGHPRVDQPSNSRVGGSPVIPEHQHTMQKTHAVGIDLGTTYSCISYLNEHGEPVTIENQEGELSTPSAVMFEEDGEVVVGTEALRNSIVYPDRVVLDSKRFIGNARKVWEIGSRRLTPVDIASYVLKKLLSAAESQIGPIEEAVITVPAQFSDFQRHATIEAGHRAGLQRVDIINEPVAAALCYVLGTEGLWFTELADEQRIMVYDLGGGTFDLSLVAYRKEEVRVIASAGDLELGGIDWTRSLVEVIARQFQKEFKVDPRDDAESRQFLTLEAEQAKRSLTARPKAALTCQHAGNRKTYQIEQSQFEKVSRGLVDRTSDITKKMLKDNRMGWAHVDVVLTTGGSSRMPMIRNKLKQMSGTTLNTSLSPDQSISHGATYYAGMLLTNNKFARSILSDEASERLSRVKQSSVNARSLGILVRDVKAGKRVPYYLLPANTSLPAEVAHTFGTVMPNQRRVNIQIVESGTDKTRPHAKLGNCVIDGLPENLPEGSEVEVTIRYDEQARVHVSAREKRTGYEASTEILRHENLAPQLATDQQVGQDFAMSASPSSDVAPLANDPVPPPPPLPKAKAAPSKPRVAPQKAPVGKVQNQQAPVAPRPKKPAGKAGKSGTAKLKPRAMPAPPGTAPLSRRPGELDDAAQPVPLCDKCGEALNSSGACPRCGVQTPPRPKSPKAGKAKSGTQKRKAVRRPAPPIDDGEILDLAEAPRPAATARPKKKRKAPPSGQNAGSAAAQKRKRPQAPDSDAGEDEFWKLSDD